MPHVVVTRLRFDWCCHYATRCHATPPPLIATICLRCAAMLSFRLLRWWPLLDGAAIRCQRAQRYLLPPHFHYAIHAADISLMLFRCQMSLLRCSDVDSHYCRHATLPPSHFAITIAAATPCRCQRQPLRRWCRSPRRHYYAPRRAAILLLLPHYYAAAAIAAFRLRSLRYLTLPRYCFRYFRHCCYLLSLPLFTPCYALRHCRYAAMLFMIRLILLRYAFHAFAIISPLTLIAHYFSIMLLLLLLMSCFYDAWCHFFIDVICRLPCRYWYYAMLLYAAIIVCYAITHISPFFIDIYVTCYAYDAMPLLRAFSDAAACRWCHYYFFADTLLLIFMLFADFRRRFRLRHIAAAWWAYAIHYCCCRFDDYAIFDIISPALMLLAFRSFHFHISRHDIIEPCCHTLLLPYATIRRRCLQSRWWYYHYWYAAIADYAADWLVDVFAIIACYTYRRYAIIFDTFFISISSP